MDCPNCGFNQSDALVECLRCGLIFSKYSSGKGAGPAPDAQAVSEPYPDRTFAEILKELLFHVNPDINPLLFGGRVLFFLLIFIWGLKIILASWVSINAYDTFWHLVNLPFHEFGHILFRPFGRLVTSLGGSMGQVLMPLVCLVYFIVKTRDTFSASFALWWAGENFIDLAPYINDARSLSLPLLGGNTGRTSPYGFHDWEFILSETQLLRYDHVLAKMSLGFGTFLMACAFAWGGYILFKQYQRLEH